ncbi:MAG: LysE family translocator [Burkholderiaceae bacterium]
MPHAAVFLTFLTALLLLEITPGPDMMLVLARGIGQGRRTALLTMAGIVFVAGVVQVGLLVLGVASLLQAYPPGLIALRWIGGAYLAYLGLRMVGSRANGRETAAAGRSSPWQALREGTVNNLTNPKSLLFMFAFLPQFVDPAVGPVWLQLLVFGSIQKLTGILSLGSVAMASGTIGQYLHRFPRLLVWQTRFTGLIMVGLGLRLLMTSDAPAVGIRAGAR